jgi:hypothetical protein
MITPIGVACTPDGEYSVSNRVIPVHQQMGGICECNAEI